jgi:uncharacterized membrane protein YfcA
MSSKTIISVGSMVGLTVGGLIPMLFGDQSLLDGWTILGGLIGGLVGIWLGIKVARRLS